MQAILWGQDGMPSHAVAPLGTDVATSDVPGVVSSQGCPDELPFLVRPQSTVRVEGTAFRISFGAAIYMCPLEGCPKQARQMASRCIPVNSG